MTAPLIDRLLGRASAHRAKGAAFDADLLDEAASNLANMLEACRVALVLTVAPSSDTYAADVEKIRAALKSAGA